MKNKNLLVKLGLITAIFGCVGLSFTSALKLNLKMGQEQLTNGQLLMIEKNIMPIHFADNGNDFGGLFYFSNGSGDDGGDFSEIVSLGTDTYTCKKQIKGWYYNAERGERLWPLDEETRKSWGLSGSLPMNGGIYTRCVTEGYEEALSGCVTKALSSDPTEYQNYNECLAEVREKYKADEDGYYGILTHTFSGQDLVLVEGVNYYSDSHPANHDFINVNKNNKELASTFIRFGNKYPVGFIYDTNGGVGFVGCRITDKSKASIKQIIGQLSGSDIQGKIPGTNIYYNSTPKRHLIELFAYSGSNGIKYVGLGSGGVTCDVISAADTLIGVVIEGIVGMGTDAERNVALNQSDEKMQYFSSASVDTNSLMNYAKQKAEQMCRGKWTCNSDDSVICCENTPSNIVKSTPTNRKTYIIKNGNVTVNPETSSNGDSYYDIFLYSGNLMVNETNTLFVFKTGGFISSTSVDAFSGNVSSIRNSSTPGGSYYSGEDAVVAGLLKGIFIVNGQIKGASGELEHKYFLYGKFSSKDSFNSLLETFKWRCNEGIGTDGSYCPQSYTIPLQGKSWVNPYANASLIVIDQNYYSPFFNA